VVHLGLRGIAWLVLLVIGYRGVAAIVEGTPSATPAAAPTAAPADHSRRRRRKRTRWNSEMST